MAIAELEKTRPEIIIPMKTTPFEIGKFVTAQNDKKLGGIFARLIAIARDPKTDQLSNKRIGKLAAQLNMEESGSFNFFRDQTVNDKKVGRFVAKVIAQARTRDTRNQWMSLDRMAQRLALK